MYANFDKNNKNINVYAEGSDLCYVCAYVDKCPLIAALQDEAVLLRYESIEVGACPMYRECTLDDILEFVF